MADEPEGFGEQGQDLRARRREARRARTYSLFLEGLREKSGLPSELAEKALFSVLCTLEQWLLQCEAGDPRSRLPVKLQEALQGCDPQRERPLRNSSVDALLQRVAGELGGDTAQAECITRAVFSTVRAHLSEGEAAQVGDELPADLRALWARAI
ncbi:DUF2267 domain-containing protein [Archangium lipolyticum]|uniref:DUF2267 domain-containing protein n=1 Tax=Archangium lipolyticum TaxID=2970465 RepID=UPI002149B202|nr:DUF2267 domain-containing protein [Archangium lipolyticum]